jgi:hypothetical protein
MPPRRIAPQPAAASAAGSFRSTLENTRAVTTSIPKPLATARQILSAAPPPAATKPATPATALTVAAAAQPAGPQLSAVQQQIYSAIMGGYYAGANNPNYSFQTGFAQGGSGVTDRAGEALCNAQESFFAAVTAGDIGKAHDAIDQINLVRRSIGLNAFWSPVTDFQILQHAGGELGEAARMYAEKNPGDCVLNQYVNTGSSMLRNGGLGMLVQYAGPLATPSGLSGFAT